MNTRSRIAAYCRLLRLHQPTGIWLLLWPCWWALALASHGLPSLRLLFLFGVGAVVMRGAGCIVNDMIDRDIDRQVERTKMRPLASGEITMTQASLVLLLLLFIALCIALQMKMIVVLLAFSSLALVVAYPFMKRVTWWPQLFLGLAFNWGALMGWAAVTGDIGSPAIALYIGSIFWTLGYDTIYAHQDTSDDSKIGVKSTALRLGKNSKYWIAGFYGCAVIAWSFAGVLNHNGPAYFASLFYAAFHFFYQVYGVDIDDPASCIRMFRSNTVLGWMVFAGLLV